MSAKATVNPRRDVRLLPAEVEVEERELRRLVELTRVVGLEAARQTVCRPGGSGPRWRDD